MKLSSQFRRVRCVSESFVNESSSALLPSRVPSLKKIAETFLSGRPIDQSLNRNLDFNPIENNPFLAKGFDLADLPSVAREVNQTLADVDEEIRQSKIAKGTQNQVQNPASEPPVPVEPTE